MPNSKEKPIHLDLDTLPGEIQPLYRQALTCSRSPWQRNRIIKMLSPEGDERPISKTSEENHKVNRKILEALIERLNQIPGITVHIQEAPFPAQRSYRINIPYDEPYVPPVRSWLNKKFEKTLEPYDIHQTLLACAESNVLYALPIAKRLIGNLFDEKYSKEQLQNELAKFAENDNSIEQRRLQAKLALLKEQQQRRETKIPGTEVYQKPIEEQFGGFLIAHRLQPNDGNINKFKIRQNAFNALVKKASYKGIQFIRTPLGPTVRYTIDYQHAGPVKFLPKMQENEYINLEAFQPSVILRKKKLLGINKKKKTDGSVRKLAPRAYQKESKIARKPKEILQRTLSWEEFERKIETQSVPRKNNK